jgi:tetratricopeptide (TPR) repeat protein
MNPALGLLKRANYPEDHPTVLKTIQCLNTAHHALSSLENSANIVKMGIKYEDAGDWVRALKMYTIAYRIRRDNLSRSHPSLIVLLNMLGSIQVKRDELEEAMEIFELALKDDFHVTGHEDAGRDKDRRGDDDSDDRSYDGNHVHEHKEVDVSPEPKRALTSGSRKENPNESCTTQNVLAKSVAYREMGIIHERWGEMDAALQMYHKSLECIAEYKNILWEAPSLSANPNHRLASMSPSSHKENVDVTSSPLGAVPLVSPSSGADDTSKSGSTPSGPASPGSPTSGPIRSVTSTESTPDEGEDDINNTTISSCPVSIATEQDILLDLESIQLSRSFVRHATVVKSHKEDDGQIESGMECFLGGCGDSTSGSRLGCRAVASSAPLVGSSCYDVFFQENDDNLRSGPRRRHPHGGRKSSRNKDASTANVDVALTLHQIGQLYRAEGEYDWALAAYAVSLRGMKRELGINHPNVASIMGNIGNLQKEMGDLNSAYETYQQVLAIESYRLGLSHPDVAITLHNIATIDAARGNNRNALTLYDQVLSLQRKLFGEGHMSLAVTATCMGDVYERIGDVEKAIDAFDEALRIKSATLGRHSVEVARLLHKLGKLSAQSGDIQLADSYLSRTVLIYRLNKMRDDDPWMIEVNRDVADIDALIAMGRADDMFEC